MKLIDLADARVLTGTQYGQIGEVRYRAPEVCFGEYVARKWSRRCLIVLGGLGWDEKVDVFALGCVLVEVWIGRPLFPVTVSVGERANALEQVLGAIPAGLLARFARARARVADGKPGFALTRRSVRDVRRHKAIRALRPLQV